MAGVTKPANCLQSGKKTKVLMSIAITFTSQTRESHKRLLESEIETKSKRQIGIGQLLACPSLKCSRLFGRVKNFGTTHKHKILIDLVELANYKGYT